MGVTLKLRQLRRKGYLHYVCACALGGRVDDEEKKRRERERERKNVYRKLYMEMIDGKKFNFANKDV